MSGLFGSDASGNESPLSPVASDRDSATPEPKGAAADGGGDALDELFGSSDEDVKMHESDGSAEGGTYTVQVPVLTARVAAVPVPRSDTGAFVLARLGNTLQLDPTPFSAASYEDPIKKENAEFVRFGDCAAVKPELALAVEGIISNTVRWRRGTGARRESNARLVRWSDGSTSVVIGGSEPETYGVAAEAGGKEQHVAVSHAREALMQSHARVTEQWVVRPTRQTAQTRAAVAFLMAGGRARAAGPKALLTRTDASSANPEAMYRQAMEEDEQRERQRRKEERARERLAARSLPQERRAAAYQSPPDDDSDDDAGAYDRAARRAPRLPLRPAPRRPRSVYVDEELDDFIDDDDDDPKVGPRDEFDSEDEEEELAARRLQSSKRSADADADARRAPASSAAKPRRLMVSDDDDSDA
ncbi:Paf1 complex component [Coemansia thaxteri]|nr:Paf1 complex component [Coemansia thaxteri]KAJ2470025.1 Paf1 complex component [Coemansia sp. RSA 2322]